jgi:hypothetical protein
MISSGVRNLDPHESFNSTMKHQRLSLAMLLAAGLIAAAPVSAQRGPRDGSRGEDGAARPTAPDTVEVPTAPSIAWFGTWESGLAEAERTGRPILLMSAAPQCHGVPGMW